MVYKRTEVPEGYFLEFIGTSENYDISKSSISVFFPTSMAVLSFKQDKWVYGLFSDKVTIMEGFVNNLKAILVVGLHKNSNLTFALYIKDKNAPFATLTDKQRWAIKKIEKTLNIKCDAKTPEEARNFINDNYSKFLSI